uniref:HTH psq-type domain-containing protein n=1 Tax=Cacopsylla melanoneura TaxID=428564 RepID=A0A8D8TGF6_9HEMI
MPSKRSWKRAAKGKKIRQYNQENMEKAINAVRSREMGYMKASSLFGVPRTTLRNLSNPKYGDVHSASSVKVGRPTVLGDQLEEQLVEDCLKMEGDFSDLTRKDLKRMALAMAIKNKLTHPFNDHGAGKKWCKLFLKRHKDRLSARKPTET